jgi:hypothetical protein
MAKKRDCKDEIAQAVTQGLKAEVDALEGLVGEEFERTLSENPTEVVSFESKKILLPVSFKAFGIDAIETYQLPELSERHRDFAFRWATESRTNADWGQIFHVSAYTIGQWKRYPKVKAYHDIIEAKRMARITERVRLLEDKAYHRLSDLLDVEFSDGTIESIRKGILNVLNISQGVIPQAEAPAIHVNQSQGQIAGAQASAGAEASAPVNLATMRERIDELALIEEIVGKGEQKSSPEPIIDGKGEAVS